MLKKTLFSIIIGLIVASLLLLIFPSLQKGDIESTEEPESWTTNTPLSYNYAVKQAAPAVVNIYSVNIDAPPRNQTPYQPLGSGVIMNKKGYIITNYHVIAAAEQIVVALQDGRIFAATRIGNDKLIDISVLKISDDNLPVIPINNKRTPHIGDIVLAIGNPYNIGQTITQGIISATGRDGLSPYRRQNFLQTDASINRGNSGGALVNTLGELVGINTISAVDKLTNENRNIPDGISFAIPTALATKIMDKLIQYGRIVRGYIGIDGGEITLNSKYQGILVKNVAGPALVAGIQPDDIIIAVNNIPVISIITTMDQITEIAPQTKIPITIIRNGEKMNLQVIVESHPN